MNRPVRIVVFGFLCLLFGVLSGCQNMADLRGAVIGPEAAEVPEGMPGGFFGDTMRQSMPAMQRALRKPAYRIGVGVESAVGLAMAVGLFAAGVGLLRDRLWSVRVAQGWSLWALLSAVVTLVLQARYLFPEMSIEMESQMQRQLPPGLVVVMGACMLPVFWAFPIAVLTILGRRPVMEYLRWRAGDGPGQAMGGGVRPLDPAPRLIEDEPGVEQGGNANATDNQIPTTPPAMQTWRDDPWNDPESK